MRLSIPAILFSLTLLPGLSQAQFGPPGGGGFGGPPGMGGNGMNNRREKEFVPGMNDDAPKGNAKITGMLTDSTSGKPVEFATVALLNQKTGKPVDGTTTDAKGKFVMSKLAAGEYRLQYSFIGYKTIESKAFKLDKNTDFNAGTVILPPDVRMLGEVSVTGQRAMIEEKVDRLVYNAEKDLTSRGGDAGDVLRKVPMLSVDLDGNVSLRGSQNIRVLINNKPSTIVAANVADALKQLPADMIKSVEVITSPSAKYDAEGAAGIINIITKKNTLHGLTLNIDSGVGIRGSNLGLNGSFRQGKLGITLGGFGRAMYNKAGSSLDQTTLRNGQSLRSVQEGTAFDKPIFGQYTLGFDYDLAKNQSLTAGVRFGTRRFAQEQHQFTTNYLGLTKTGTTSRDVDRLDQSNSVDVNVDYIRTFKPQQEWSVSTQYSRTGLINNFNADILSLMSDPIRHQQNINNNVNGELTVQTDYQTPVKKNQLFEVGGKLIRRQVDSRFEYNVAFGDGDYIRDRNNPSGSLNYEQMIQAGYVSYTYVTKNKYTFKVGTRYEHTGISAKSNENIALNIPGYSNLVPSVNVSKTIKGATLKAAYNRRIQRPGLQQLNPNVNAANPQMIMVGNPTLNPELTDNVELSLSKSIKKVYLNAAVFGRFTNNAITMVRLANDSIPGGLISTFQNIGVQRTFGANVFFNASLTPKWSVNGGLDGYHMYLEGMAQGADGKSTLITNSGVSIGGRIMTQLTLPKSWSLQGFSFFRGPMPQLQGRMGGMYMYSIGLRKDIAQKRGSIGLAAENFIGKGVRMQTVLNSPTLSQVSVTNLYNQNVKLTFAYRLGKMTFEQPRRRSKSVSNDDVKSEN